MPNDLTRENANIGRVVYQWTVKEYEEYERGRRWYLVIGGLALALVLFAVFTANYLFALIIILFGIILYLHDLQTPLEVPFALTDVGIILGKKFYRYSELGNFWIIYNPPEVKVLYFSLGNFLRHRLQVPLLEYDPRPIREHLSLYLVEDLDQEEEPLSDRVGRLLGFH
ncbi:MAG: hypothetical protein Q7K39_02285 [Candidatus Magasanikbacteria bacterium]|nr:hypothetical protein [Candidatus Magasanikbacteria bacterium]